MVASPPLQGRFSCILKNMSIKHYVKLFDFNIERLVSEEGKLYFFCKQGTVSFIFGMIQSTNVTTAPEKTDCTFS